MAYQREKQRIASNEILQAIASGEDIDMYQCSISGALDINRLLEKTENFDLAKVSVRQKKHKRELVLDQKIRFYDCIFEENVFFASPWSEQDFLDVVFKRDVIFNSSTFSGQTRFSGATFRGRAGFDGCKFLGVASFTEVDFKAQAFFRTVEFLGYGLFNDVSFHKEARFVNTLFDKGGNFRGVRFLGKVDFTGVYAGSKSVPIFEGIYFARKSYGEDESFWRFVKQAAQDAGYYRLCGNSFYNERCAMLYRKFMGSDFDNLSTWRKTLRCIAGVRLLPEFIFGKLLFGYGEKPMRVLFAALTMIVVCAALYSWKGSLLSKSGHIIPHNYYIDMLYFSATTFTTLGFGDICPDPLSKFTKVVAMIEAMGGASLTALFVVCLAKRFSRS